MNERMCVMFATKKVEMRPTREALKEKIEQGIFPHGAKIIAFAGTHGYSGGKLGAAAPKSITQWETGVMKQLNNKEVPEQNICREKNYEILPAVAIHEQPKDLDSEASEETDDIDYGKVRKNIQDQFKSMAEKKYPYVVVLFFCHSKKSDFNPMLVQLGLMTVQSIKRDRADITDARCWILDEQQRCVLQD